MSAQAKNTLGRSASKDKQVGGGHLGGRAPKPQIPLLDEVSSLLEKEKLLHELKMMESKLLADEWKMKYEKLVGQVADNAAISGHYHTYEIAADIEATEMLVGESKHTDAHHLLSQSRSQAIDVSCQPISKQDLMDLTTSVKELPPQPVALLMSRTGLTDAKCSSSDRIPNADLAGSLISASNVEALDISYNELGTGFEDALVGALRMKKKPLQYLLVNGNMGMALCPQLSDILSLMSERSWGLSVSLEDLADLPTHESKTARSHATDFSGGSQKSMRCADFLRVLNGKLEQSVSGLEAIELAKVDKKKMKVSTAPGKHVKHESETASKRVRATERRPNGLQFMSVLGLTDATLSKSSLQLLTSTLKLTVASLTELDISYSYSGLLGATMIRDALSDRNCQLIRLGLAGNIFRDRGIETIHMGLRQNSTLTYLDLRSNLITGVGLATLMQLFKHDSLLPSVSSTEAEPIGTGNCQTLTCIDFTGNPMEHADILVAQRTVRSVGREVNIKFMSPKSRLVPLSEMKKVDKKPGDGIITLYASPQLLSCELMIGSLNEKLIYSVDCRHLLVKMSSRPHALIVLEWYARVGGGRYLLPKFQSALSGGGSSKPREVKDSEDARLSLPTESVAKGIRWEVRYATQKGETVEVSTLLCPNAGLGSSEWVLCRAAVFREPPVRGSLEIYAIISGRQAALLECFGLKVYSVPAVSSEGLDGCRYVGGDVLEWTPGMNSLVSMHCLENLNSSTAFAGLNGNESGNVLTLLPTGDIPLRALRWTLPISSGKLTFLMKLCAVGGVGSATSIGSEEHDDSGRSAFDPFFRDTPLIDVQSASSVGYLWNISIYGSNGSYQCLEVDGGCLSQNELEANVSQTIDNPTRPNPLLSWMWRPFAVDVGILSPNDTIVVSGSVVGDSSGQIARRCTLQIKDCRLFAQEEDLRVISQVYDISGAGGGIKQSSSSGPLELPSSSLSFSVHNDPMIRYL